LNIQPRRVPGGHGLCRRRIGTKVRATVDVGTGPFSVVAHRDDARRLAGCLDFEAAVTTVGDAAMVRITGDLDCSTAPQLRSVLVRLVDGGTRHLTVDIAGAELVDSTGLSVLVGGMKRLRDHGGCMVVRSPSEAARRVLEITGLDRILDIS